MIVVYMFMETTLHPSQPSNPLCPSDGLTVPIFLRFVGPDCDAKASSIDGWEKLFRMKVRGC